jgi:hypothetical protein
VGRVYVDEHVFVGAEDGACVARSVLAKHDILRNDDHREEAVSMLSASWLMMSMM